MSKKKKKQRKQKNLTVSHEYEDKILDDLLRCNTNCASMSHKKKIERTGLEQIEHLIDVLPGVNYIKTLFLDYIFSSGITTGSIIQDDILGDFLYRKNMQGDTNLATLRDTIGSAALYGETGLRKFNGDLYMVKPGTYGALLRRTNGIEYPVGYVIAEDGRFLDGSDVQIPEDTTYEEFMRILEDQKLIFLSNSEFVNIRNDTSQLHGDPPFLRDKLRLALLESVYSRLGYDVDYDGPGRLILRPRGGYVTGDINEVSTSRVMQESMSNAEKRLKGAQAELARVGEAVKNSSSDSVILLSDAFDDHIEHLERVTKATEFLDWIGNEGEIIAQAVGMSPSLLELGKVSGNVSMQRILDNAMENTIVPLREHYAIQFSAFVANMLGIDHVYFGKYQLQSAPDINTTRTKVVEMMTMLNGIDTPEARQLVKDFASMLSYNIHNDDKSLVRLGVSKSDILEKVKLIEQKESKSNEQTT